MNRPFDLIASAFANRGQADFTPCAQCPTDDALAGFFDRALSATETRAIEDHALECAATHQLLTNLADLRLAEAPATAKPGLRIRARLAEQGIALLNAIDLTVRGLTAEPALGAVRGDNSGEKASELVRISGPGAGLDEIELQAQADGTVRFVVSGDLSEKPSEPGTAPAGNQRTSVVLEVDGTLREKRPYSGGRVTFAPLAGGDCRITVLRRPPGGPTVEVSEARIVLCA